MPTGKNYFLFPSLATDHTYIILKQQHVSIRGLGRHSSICSFNLAALYKI